jgi:putative ATP-dependent endonuclease of the OLD family
MDSPKIRKLTIERFRCIESLTWRPANGVNVILGGGDVGKTTILDAIALLLSPTNFTAISDTDYYDRDVDKEFTIEAILSLPASTGISDQSRPSWVWRWDGVDARVPSADTKGEDDGEQVYRLRVRGTADLEPVYEVVQPNDEANTLSIVLRRGIGLVRLSGEDRNDRDLRLVQGSALDRLLSDKLLRSRLGAGLADRDVKAHLAPEKKEALDKLNGNFKVRGLPSDLDLAVTGAQGFSVSALIGLTAKRRQTRLPLASWGAGTRRFASLTIAEQNQGEAPITLVDEVERGLEPYRMRSLIATLMGSNSQVFLTTQSPIATSTASQATLWYLDRSGVIGELPLHGTSNHRKSDPEAFLSRLTIVVEGLTEQGFVSAMLEKAIGDSLQTYGIHISDGGGHEPTLSLLEALAKSGLRFGGFADDERKHPGRWGALSTKLDTLLFRWQSGCTEENVINLVPEENLESLLNDPEDEKTGYRLRTLMERLGMDGEQKDFATIRAIAGDKFRSIMTSAACGLIPDGTAAEKRKEFKSHGRSWFKTLEGGRELFEKARSLGVWPSLRSNLIPFCNAVRAAVDKAEIQDIGP